MTSEDQAMARVHGLQAVYPPQFQKGSPLGGWYPEGWNRILHQPCGSIRALIDDESLELPRRRIPTSSVKRSVLAMSMRFSYDATTLGGRLNCPMTAPTASLPNPCLVEEPNAITGRST